jgi:hypothetical protein
MPRLLCGGVVYFQKSRRVGMNWNYKVGLLPAETAAQAGILSLVISLSR